VAGDPSGDNRVYGTSSADLPGRVDARVGVMLQSTRPGPGRGETHVASTCASG